MTMRRHFQTGTLDVRVYAGRAQMGAAAAHDVADALCRRLAEKEQVNLMFAAAPSQNEVLAGLAMAGSIDWRRVNAFHMDEYVDLAATHPSGFGNFLQRAIFGALPFGNVFLLDGNAINPQAEAKHYAGLLKEHPLDICLMGVGENGHLAFNDPPVADFADPALVKVVELDEACRRQQVNDGCFSAIGEVPTHALTVTIPGLITGREVFCVVPGPTKAQAVRHMLHDEIAVACPATILKRHPAARLYLDTDSASLLP